MLFYLKDFLHLSYWMTPRVTHFQKLTVSTEQWGPLSSIFGKCLEFLFMSFRHFPSLDHSSVASHRKSRQREAFPPVFQNPASVGFSLGENPPPCRGQQRLANIQPWGSRCEQREQGPSPGRVRFYGHVLTVQNSHEECLLKSWRLNHK